jgi:hypothetical protein
VVNEAQYQARLIKKLDRLFPGCIIFKMDPGYLQGVPDLLILWQDRWALLEVKRSAESLEQPNQAYYVKKLHKMSFSAFIYPENEAEVLSALQQAFESSGRACVPQS